MLAGAKSRFAAIETPTTQGLQSKDQLRRDRRTAIIVVAIMAAVMGLTIWLASMSGGSFPAGTEYWQMMP